MATRKTNSAYPSAKPPPGSSYAVMSVGAYVFASILMSIPFIGLVICIIWAFVSCNNLNKRNFARAYLIFMIIGIVFSLVFYLSITFFTSKLAMFGEFGGLKGFFDMLKELRNI